MRKQLGAAPSTSPDAVTLDDLTGVPSYARGYNAKGRYRPDLGRYNASGASLHGLRAAWLKLVNGDADLHLAAAGDSMLGGWDGTAYTFEHCVPRTIGKQLAKARGVGFCNGIQLLVADTNSTPRVYDNVTKGGFTSQINPFPSLKSTAASQTCSFVTLDPGTTVDVYVWDNCTGTLALTIDGVSQTGITFGGTNAVVKKTFTGLANTTHTVAFNSGASGQIIVAHWVKNTSIKQIYAHNVSLGGSTANTASPIYTNWSDTTSGANPGLGWFMQQILSAASVTPDITLVSAGGNDVTGGTGNATAVTGLSNIFGYSWLGSTKSYLHTYKPTSGVVDGTWDDFSGKVYAQCDTSAVSMLDIDDYLNRRNSASSDGLIGSDGTHPTVALQRGIGGLVADMWHVGLLAPSLLQVRLESGSAYTPRFSTAITPAGYSPAEGADSPTDGVDGDPWDDEP